MAKFVIAGKAGCSSYVRAEMLADLLAATLQDFRINKVVISKRNWSSWVLEECEKRGWTHKKSPLIWRELVDTGGKGSYLGGLEQFEEYAMKYYNITPSTDAQLEKEIAEENLHDFEQQVKAKKLSVPKPPFKICLTNASSPLCYQLAHHIAAGRMLDQKVAIHLYQTKRSQHARTEGVVMELQDLASPLLDYVITTTSLREAFTGIDFVFVLDYPYTPPNPDSPDSSAQADMAAKLFQYYSKGLDAVASKDVRVIVTGRYGNSGATLMAACVKTLLPSSFVAAPSLAQSQIRAVLGNRLKLNSSDIQQVVVWGKTHGDVLPDASFVNVSHFPGAIVGPDPFTLALRRCEFDLEWLAEEFPRLVKARHCQQEGYKEGGPTLAEATGLAALGRHWIVGQDQWESVGLVSDGELYNIPKGIAYSVPCRCKEGKWEPIPDLELSEKLKEQLAIQVKEIKSEVGVLTSALGIQLDVLGRTGRSTEGDSTTLDSSERDSTTRDSSQGDSSRGYSNSSEYYSSKGYSSTSKGDSSQADQV